MCHMLSSHVIYAFFSYNAFAVYIYIMPKKKKALQHLAKYNRRGSENKKKEIHEENE